MGWLAERWSIVSQASHEHLDELNGKSSVYVDTPGLSDSKIDRDM